METSEAHKKLEVVRIKKILVQNLLIYIGLHCVRRSSWTVTTLATLIQVSRLKNDYQNFTIFGNRNIFEKKNAEYMVILLHVMKCIEFSHKSLPL